MAAASVMAAMHQTAACAAHHWARLEQQLAQQLAQPALQQPCLAAQQLAQLQDQWGVRQQLLQLQVLQQEQLQQQLAALEHQLATAAHWR